MRRRLFLPFAICPFAICSFAAFCHFAAAQQWRELGPAPVSWFGGSSGRISAIACSPTDPDRTFAGGADGGVWRTIDGGATWQPVTPHAPTSAIGALAIDPANENIIYAGTGEANYANHSRYGLGLLKSVDGGDTWELLADETFAGRTFARIAINPDRPSMLYAAIGRAGGFPELAAAKGHPQAEGPVGVFKSEDAGRSWRLLEGLPAIEATDLALDSGDPDTIYAGIGRIFGHTDNGVYRSRDGGETWTKLTGGLPTESPGRISLGTAPSRPQTVYALLTRVATASGGSAGNIGGYRSDDGGDTWRPYGSVHQSSYGWYLSVTTVHPTDADVVFYGGLDMTRVSGAGGFTVTPPHVDVHAIEFDAAGRLISGDDGGVHRSENLGALWTSVNEGLGTAQFYAGLSTSPADERMVFGGLQDNGSNLRADDSLAWQTVIGGDGGWTQIDQTRPNRMFGESQGTGALRRSTDGGESWGGVGGSISGRNCFLPPYVIDPSNPDRMLYATHRIHESLTGGGGWSVISTDLTNGEGAIRALAIAPSDSAFVYIATNDGNVQVSEDGGRTFRLSLDDHPGWPRVTHEIWVSPSDPQTALLAGAHFGVDQVRRTRDAGRIWESLDGDLPDVPVNVVIADERATPPTLYAGADTGVFYSINDGATWRRYSAGLHTCAVVDLILEPERDRLVIGTQGRGAWSVRAPAAPCPADCDGDGALTFFDFLCFQDAFARGDPWADFDTTTGRGRLDFFDLLAFQNAFAGGC
jgi:photosystem II stability/assembly factor-like uncharacterized protein